MEKAYTLRGRKYDQPIKMCQPITWEIISWYNWNRLKIDLNYKASKEMIIKKCNVRKADLKVHCLSQWPNCLTICVMGVDFLCITLLPTCTFYQIIDNFLQCVYYSFLYSNIYANITEKFTLQFRMACNGCMPAFNKNTCNTLNIFIKCARKLFSFGHCSC